MICDGCPLLSNCPGERHARYCELRLGDTNWDRQLRVMSGVEAQVDQTKDRPVQNTEWFLGFSRLLVVSRYRENLDWLNEISVPTVVYNKGGALDLPAKIGVRHVVNRGREAGTILQAIVDHYDKLPSVLYFVQGNNHADNLQERLAIQYKKPTSLTTRYKHDFPGDDVKDMDKIEYTQGYESRYGLACWHGDRTPKVNRAWLKSVWDFWFSSPQPHNDEWYFGYCGEWGVNKESILARPLAFWKHALDQVLKADNDPQKWTSEPTTAWGMELIWNYLFDSRYVVKMPQPKAEKPPIQPACRSCGGAVQVRSESLDNRRRAAIREAVNK